MLGRGVFHEVLHAVLLDITSGVTSHVRDVGYIRVRVPYMDVGTLEVATGFHLRRFVEVLEVPEASTCSAGSLLDHLHKHPQSLRLRA